MRAEAVAGPERMSTRTCSPRTYEGSAPAVARSPKNPPNSFVMWGPTVTCADALVARADPSKMPCIAERSPKEAWEPPMEVVEMPVRSSRSSFAHPENARRMSVAEPTLPLAAPASEKDASWAQPAASSERSTLVPEVSPAISIDSKPEPANMRDASTTAVRSHPEPSDMVPAPASPVIVTLSQPSIPESISDTSAAAFGSARSARERREHPKRTRRMEEG